MTKEEITIDAVCKNIVIPEDHSLVIGCTAVITDTDVRMHDDGSVIRRACWEIMRSVICYGNVYEFDHVDVHGYVYGDDGKPAKISKERENCVKEMALKEITGMLTDYVNVRKESEHKDTSAMAIAHIKAIKK